jgi:hypothetical protein
MKKLLLAALLFATSNSCFPQSKWVTKNIDNNLSIDFPGEPNKDQKADKRLTMYAFRNEESKCTLSVVVKNAALLNYSEIIKLPIDKQNAKIDSFLTKGLDDLLKNDKIIVRPINLRIGVYSGKQFTYQMNNDINGKITTVFAKIVFIRNNLYLVQCYIDNGGSCEFEKKTFLNSIKTN